MSIRATVRASRVPGVLAMAVLAGLSYPYSFTRGLPPEQAIAWKGLGVGLLAVWAAVNARGRDGCLLAATLALWAAGNVVLELSFAGGAALFAAGHVVVITLFRRHRRLPTDDESTRRAVGFVLLLPVGAMYLTLSTGWMILGFGVYALLLAATVAATAEARSFRIPAAGAAMFAVSDMLIFARAGGHVSAPIVSYAIWWLYFIGVLLIALGTRAGLDREHENH